MKRRPYFAAPVLALALCATASSALAQEKSLEIRLKSFQEVPSVSSAAAGRFKLFLDESSGAIHYDLSYTGLEGTVTQGHIHFGQRGVNGGIMVWLCQTSGFVDPAGRAPVCAQSGTVSGVLAADNVVGPAGQGIAAGEFSEALKAIRAGVAYVNVHSTKFPAGELRGQLHDGD